MSYKDKEKEKQNKREYYLKNRKKLLEQARERGKKWYRKNRKKVRLQHREYYKNNKEHVSQYHKKWYRINKSRILQRCKKYYQRNKARLQRHHREYNRKNKEKLMQYKRVWKKYRRKINPKYRLDENMRSAIARSLKNKNNGRGWEVLVGYTLKKLMQHLEESFDIKMNWNNYGNYWTVDHIKPRRLFNYASPNDFNFKECWALKNLQPLEKIENIRKGGRLLISDSQ